MSNNDPLTRDISLANDVGYIAIANIPGFFAEHKSTLRGRLKEVRVFLATNSPLDAKIYLDRIIRDYPCEYKQRDELLDFVKRASWIACQDQVVGTECICTSCAAKRLVARIEGGK